VDDRGQQVAVFDTGHHLTTIPTAPNDLQVGHEYEAQSRYERAADRRRVLSWQFEDLERTRERDR
jgi:hypothetical protein